MTILPDPRERPLLCPADLVGLIPGMKRSAIYEAIRRGDLPCVRVGSRVFLPTAQLRRMWGIDPEQSEGASATDAPLATAGSTPTTELESSDDGTRRRAG